MEDTIYRQEALEGLYDVFFDNELSAAYPKEADKVLDVIRKLPSAQPVADDDLVSREAVKKWLERWDGYIDMDIVRRMQYRVIDIPSTQSDRKNGKWIKISRSWLHDDVQCSECGNMLDMNGVNAGRGDANFCPNCGCRMEGEIK